MNRFQKKEAREVNELINHSHEKRVEQLFCILKAEARYIRSGKRFNEKEIEDRFFKKIRRQYRKEARIKQKKRGTEKLVLDRRK